MTKTIRIGSGAGYAGDRLEPSLELIEKGNLDYISYECLAERTIAIGQQAKLKDPSKGYNGLLEHRMEKALPLCWKHKVKLITNMGSANPQAAAQKCVEIARRHGLTGMKIACVTICCPSSTSTWTPRCGRPTSPCPSSPVRSSPPTPTWAWRVF